MSDARNAYIWLTTVSMLCVAGGMTFLSNPVFIMGMFAPLTVVAMLGASLLAFGLILLVVTFARLERAADAAEGEKYNNMGGEPK